MTTPATDRKKPVKAQRPDTRRVIPAEIAKEIVFGTRLARSLVDTERPEELIHLTAARIWSNLEAFVAVGDWPDRRRTAEEVDRG